MISPEMYVVLLFYSCMCLRQYISSEDTVWPCVMLKGVPRDVSWAAHGRLCPGQERDSPPSWAPAFRLGDQDSRHRPQEVKMGSPGFEWRRLGIPRCQYR